MTGDLSHAKVESLPRFVLHTGNVNQGVLLKRREGSNEELVAGIRHVGELLKDHEIVFSSALTVKLPGEAEQPDFNKDDVKITLKVFLKDFCPVQVEQAINVGLSELRVDAIAQVIVAFPEDEEDTSGWLEKVLPVWKKLEDLVDAGSVYALGVADVDVARLKALSEAVKRTPPKIDHYSIEGCCTVPPELVEYAKANDIQLLTHNDAKVVVGCDSLKKVTSEVLGASLDAFHCCWTARYTVWLRSRSVVSSKGFFVGFSKDPKDC